MSQKRSTVPQGKTGGNGLPGSGTNSGATSTEARAGVIATAPASSTFMPTVGATPNYSNTGGTAKRAGAPLTAAPASSTFMPTVGATPAYSTAARGARDASPYMPGTPRPAGATPELIPLPISAPPAAATSRQAPGEDHPEPDADEMPGVPPEPGTPPDESGLPPSKRRD